MDAKAGAGTDGAVVEVKGAGVGRAGDGGDSDLLPLVFLDPQKVTERSSRFQ